MAIGPRLKAALSRYRNSREITIELSQELVGARKRNRDAEDDVRWLSAHLKFLGRDVISDYRGSMKVFTVDDGETYNVAAASGLQAIEACAAALGYSTPAEYRDEFSDA